MNLEEEKRKAGENNSRGRIVRTTNIDMFMNCEDVNYQEEELAPEKTSSEPMEEDEEEDPIWDQVDV